MREGLGLSADDFNIDHIVISRTRVFAVETKGFTKPARGSDRAAVRLILDGKWKSLTLRVGSLLPIGTSGAPSRWLSQWAAEQLGLEFVRVGPVLALPGWFVDRRANGPGEKGPRYRSDAHVATVGAVVLPRPRVTARLEGRARPVAVFDGSICPPDERRSTWYHRHHSLPHNKMPIPIVDLFAGPGGLGEGFSSLKTMSGAPAFRIGLSVEKDETAHRTLTLRAAFRALQGLPAEEHYYDYIRGSISSEEFKAHPVAMQALAHAAAEARCLELGKADEGKLDKEIRQALDGANDWVLIGGPPCQAYSLAGRSRRANDLDFANDEKHFLYREYLRIIRVHKPVVFVMENVKGLISSRHSGSGMFVRILEDLARPVRGLEYEIRSAIVANNGQGLEPDDYVIEAEKFGVPQNRHRVILIGVRSDLASGELPLLEPQRAVSIGTAIGDFPKIRSRLSTKTDSAKTWSEAVIAGVPLIGGWGTTGEVGVRKVMELAAKASAEIESPGEPFAKYPQGLVRRTDEFSRWVVRPLVGGYCQHVSRRHMAKDLARYLFASSFAEMFGHSPRLHSFPPRLLPAHKNATIEEGFPFKDRFRVHCAHEPAWTVVSHIAKDGHYYIHYDPSQCRSLTVREAARVQTFPDDYFFEGNRTQQYTQVGNAVPPLLASKIARLVHTLLSARTAKARSRGTDSRTVAGAAL